MRRTLMALALVGLLASTMGVGAALATSAARSTENVVWTYDPTTPIGTSTLVRTDAGLSATFTSAGIPPGQAVTLWFIVFNNPSACATTCGLADLLFNLDAQGDALAGGGHVIGSGGTVNIGGSLKVGDASGSFFPEIGFPAARAIGLTNPRGAQVGLLVHSHGPMVPGQVLTSQISSFTGGCTVFLGDLELPGSGLADGPEDVPDAIGECSTLQASVHLP